MGKGLWQLLVVAALAPACGGGALQPDGVTSGRGGTGNVLTLQTSVDDTGLLIKNSAGTTIARLIQRAGGLAELGGIHVSL